MASFSNDLQKGTVMERKIKLSLLCTMILTTSSGFLMAPPFATRGKTPAVERSKTKSNQTTPLITKQTSKTAEFTNKAKQAAITTAKSVYNAPGNLSVAMGGKQDFITNPTSGSLKSTYKTYNWNANQGGQTGWNFSTLMKRPISIPKNKISSNSITKNDLNLTTEPTHRSASFTKNPTTQQLTFEQQKTELFKEANKKKNNSKPGFDNFNNSKSTKLYPGTDPFASIASDTWSIPSKTQTTSRSLIDFKPSQQKIKPINKANVKQLEKNIIIRNEDAIKRFEAFDGLDNMETPSPVSNVSNNPTLKTNPAQQRKQIKTPRERAIAQRNLRGKQRLDNLPTFEDITTPQQSQSAPQNQVAIIPGENVRDLAPRQNFRQLNLESVQNGRAEIAKQNRNQAYQEPKKIVDANYQYEDISNRSQDKIENLPAQHKGNKHLKDYSKKSQAQIARQKEAQAVQESATIHDVAPKYENTYPDNTNFEGSRTDAEKYKTTRSQNPRATEFIGSQIRNKNILQNRQKAKIIAQQEQSQVTNDFNNQDIYSHNDASVPTINNNLLKNQSRSGSNSPTTVAAFPSNEQQKLKKSETKRAEKPSVNSEISYLNGQNAQDVHAIALANSQRAPVTLPVQISAQ